MNSNKTVGMTIYSTPFKMDDVTTILTQGGIEFKVVECPVSSDFLNELKNEPEGKKAYRFDFRAPDEKSADGLARSMIDTFQSHCFRIVYNN